MVQSTRKAKATAPKRTVVSSESGSLRVLSDSDLDAIGNKIKTIRSNTGGESSASSGGDSPVSGKEVVQVLTDLNDGLKAANQAKTTAEDKLVTVSSELTEAQETLATTQASLTEVEAKNKALEQELAEHRTNARASEIALKASTLRAQAEKLVKAKVLSPADFNDFFGKDDTEFGEKVQAMAEDETAYTFANQYVERLQKYAPAVSATNSSIENDDGLEVVEPPLKKTTQKAGSEGETKTIAKKAAALVVAQLQRPAK